MVTEKSLNNLKHLGERPDSKEIQRAGGIASGIAKKKRKTLKEELLLILEDEKVQNNITKALIERATLLDNTGNKAFTDIRDTIGEKPTEKQEIDVNAAIKEDKLSGILDQLWEEKDEE